jgi:hypothetical protein
VPIEAQPLAFVRATCLALPETSERLSHGAPSFFVREKRAFVHFMDDHHGDGRLAIWCAAPPGVQQAVVASDPERYFVPPYVGPRGWLGVRLDRDLSEDHVAEAIERAYVSAAPPTLLRATGMLP